MSIHSTRYKYIINKVNGTVHTKSRLVTSEMFDMTIKVSLSGKTFTSPLRKFELQQDKNIS